MEGRRERESDGNLHHNFHIKNWALLLSFVQREGERDEEEDNRRNCDNKLLQEVAENDKILCGAEEF